jgi:hypothetical protein
MTPATAAKDIGHLRKRIGNKAWKGIIVKPSYGGYAAGIKVFKDIGRTKNTTLAKYFRTLKHAEFPSVTIQQFVPSFSQHFELRTYWLNEKYAYTIGTLTNAVGGTGLTINDEDTFEREGGSLPDHVWRRIKSLGADVIKALPRYPWPYPILRIDFGCCIGSDQCADTYFVNEVETMACNLLPADTQYPIVQKLAKRLFKFATHVRGKKIPKMRRSKYKSRSTLCVKPIE